VTDDQTQTPAPTQEFKKEPSAKVVISEDEFKSLEAKVLAAKKAPSEEELYRRALDEVKAEVAASQKQTLEDATKAEQARLMAELKAKVEALESRPVPGGKKGYAPTTPPPAEGGYRKTADGKLEIPIEDIRTATLRSMFPEQVKNLPRTSPNKII
jgi:hypothetical protein